MTRVDVSDCIAMSEDGDWFAYPRTLTRGQAMAAVARSAEDVGYYSWHETLRRFRVVVGYIALDAAGYWWSECEASDDGAVCVWLVQAK